MSAADTVMDRRDIVLDEILPHRPEMVWTAITHGTLMSRWIRMPVQGFEPVVGCAFTMTTTPAGAWDGLIRCTVLEVVPNERLAYRWTSGDAGNVGYGALLDTVVTFTLSRAPEGTRLQLVHSGFVLPRNETAFTNMSQGWISVTGRIGEIAGEQTSS